MRVLVLRPGAIGDTLVTLPALAALRHCFPDARIQMVGNAAALPLVESTGLIDDWIPFDDLRVSHLFSGREPSCSDPFLGIHVAVAWCADPDGVLRRSLVARGAQEPIIVPLRPAPGGTVHVARRLLETLASLGIDPAHDLPLPPFRLTAQVQQAAQSELAAAGLGARPVVAVHAGSGSPAKNWPPEQFAAVLAWIEEERSLDSIVFGGPADAGTLDAVRRHAGCPVTVMIDRPLLLVAAMLRRACAFLGNDSGLSHLAGLLGVPTLALFGPTDPANWAPLGPRVRVIRTEPLVALPRDRVTAALAALLDG